MTNKTLAQKIWDKHVIHKEDGLPDLLYVDLHLIHEVTSPQAFEGLRINNRKVRRPDLCIATIDHNVPTTDRTLPNPDPLSIKQIDTLRKNTKEFNIPLLDIFDNRQGIVHVIGPEQGLTQPGLTIVCGDSHTSTHGAFGSLAFGIGTSEVEHVLATQSLPSPMPKMMQINIKGNVKPGITGKDIILAIINKIGVDGGIGHIIEYTGDAIKNLSMEGRMTVCNMTIEAGARAGLIAPDQVTFDYLKNKPLAPKGEEWERALTYWNTLYSDENCKFDTIIEIDAATIEPFITWGTNPAQSIPVSGIIPDPDQISDPFAKETAQRALKYMELSPGTKIQEVKINKVFIGSCTNSRIEDLRAASKIVNGKNIADNVHAIVVPGSGLVKKQAEDEGIDQVFINAGFEWREAGCSMCLGMNPDILKPGERCASTSNRNFEGRQGQGGRTHLVSPEMAAAAAIAGHFTDVRNM
ncbi:MAG: 3-isopropylmalate dehydratase large subunit [Dehalococcoidia bacterium]|jgi:3-isopropylmalate/(R)-2-methylmalate dehydratase large subunit|nr:MAG: 3-isopropylmalate/(R)-2-methylmalate dehydratase large subunit [Chloroflexota bacterium]|tara:strand:- start:887 stop:2287 length:1401 start_codon:yes stop_codon:yes gene_type:complete